MTLFADVCEHGGHFCKRCQRFVSVIDSEDGYLKCERCGCRRVKFCPPVPDYHKGEEPNQRVASQGSR